MAVEAKRGCGYRKVGSLYLVGPKKAFVCDRGLIPLHVCPTCGKGFKPARGWTWLNPHQLFGEHKKCKDGPKCILCYPPDSVNGMLWVGGMYYDMDSFTKEARRLGVSRRIFEVPRRFELGKTVVYLAYREAIPLPPDEEEKPSRRTKGKETKKPKQKFQPAIFMAFKPLRIEQIITESQSQDEEFMAGLEKRKITPVVVPDDDPDHKR